MVKAKMVRTGIQNYIKVFCSGIKGEPNYLFNGIIEHCARDLSPNELRKVLEDCEVQMKKLVPENTPKIFEEMVEDLKSAMVARNIPVDPPPPSLNITIVFRIGRRIKQLINFLKQLFRRVKLAL